MVGVRYNNNNVMVPSSQGKQGKNMVRQSQGILIRSKSPGIVLQNDAGFLIFR